MPTGHSTPLPYLQLDVFAETAGAGNALGVVVDGAGFDPAHMQAFAAWTNLSETIFLLPPTQAGADYRVRIFTPRQELPFAGHPSVGAAWAVLDSGRVSADASQLVQECAAGLLPVRIVGSGDARRPQVRAPRARRVGGVELAPALLAAALAPMPGVVDSASIDSASDGSALAPALWNNGPGWWLVPMSDAACVRGLRADAGLDADAIAALTLATGAVGLAVFAPEDRDGHHLALRAFCPADNIPEDPVTGSAQACIAAALAAAGQLPGRDGRYVGSQGRELGRDGRVDVCVDADGEVWIGGAVQRVIAGSVRW
jgi:PhzF family phenazine biosynthesis protein